MNRLAREKSPYLLQHATNPVSWFPWGEEAFAKARSEDKPVFLSIGYSTCHWCHVMAHESFEDADVAALMNETFINIKVDREERPDIDNTYMTVCQLITGQGGWPLTLILTPEKKPFYAATYLPKHSLPNRIGMLDFVPAIAGAWKNERSRVEETAQRISDGFRKTLDLGRSRTSVSPEIIEQTVNQLSARFDPEHGGFGQAPKFPSPHNILFLLNHYQITGSANSLSMAESTLTGMRQGGIWDHIGFGFHRYSTDAEWLVPHFEKMLHDQALLLLAYAEAWNVTGKPFYMQTAIEISSYVHNRLTSPGGGFYSAEDADSEGEEGKFYLWSTDEIRETVSQDEADLFMETYHFEEEGNFHEEATGRKTGKNIPHRIPSGSGGSGYPLTDSVSDKLRSALDTLRTTRNKRVPPFLDDKILTDWNSLMIAALARAGTVCNEPDFIRTAEKAWNHIHDHCFEYGFLKHMSKEGDAGINGMADDYAFLVWGLIELYQATLKPVFLESAIQLQNRMDQLFYDDEHGGYYFTSRESEQLMGRQKEIYDGAIPSSNSVSVRNNYYLSALTGSASHMNRALQILTAFSEQIEDAPAGYVFALDAFQLLNAERAEIVITAAASDAQAEEMADLCRNEMPPGSVILLLTEQNQALLQTLAPFTKNFKISETPAVYICKNYSCKRPVTTAEEVVQTLRTTLTKDDADV